MSSFYYIVIFEAILICPIEFPQKLSFADNIPGVSLNMSLSPSVSHKLVVNGFIAYTFNYLARLFRYGIESFPQEAHNTWLPFFFFF